MLLFAISWVYSGSMATNGRWWLWMIVEIT